MASWLMLRDCARNCDAARAMRGSCRWAACAGTVHLASMRGNLHRRERALQPEEPASTASMRSALQAAA